MLEKTLSPFFYQKSKIKIRTPIWGLKEPITEDELNQYHAELSGFLNELDVFGFTFYMVNSYGNQVLVVKKAAEVTI